MKIQSPGIPVRQALGLAVSIVFSLSLAACGEKAAETPLLSTTPAAPAAVAAPASTTVGNEIDDSVVTTRVKSALLADQNVKSFEIKVETRKGQVQLSGFVDNQPRIDYAIALVGRLEGVRGVENAMSVKDGKATVGNAVDDSIVTTKVKSALLADATVSSSDIAVATRKSEVQLSGYVADQAQIDRAVAITLAVEGVRAIDNQMSIKK